MSVIVVGLLCGVALMWFGLSFYNNVLYCQTNNITALFSDSPVFHLISSLFNSDSATELKISVKDARRKLFKHQIQPFDVVEELNKSVEHWVATARPSPQQIHRTITQISKFLAEFSKLMRSTPTFTRIRECVQCFPLCLCELKVLYVRLWQ